MAAINVQFIELDQACADARDNFDRFMSVVTVFKQQASIGVSREVMRRLVSQVDAAALEDNLYHIREIMQRIEEQVSRGKKTKV